jgi:hypothetical protein
MYVLAPHISLLRSFKSCFGILFCKHLVPPGPGVQTTEKISDQDFNDTRLAALTLLVGSLSFSQTRFPEPRASLRPTTTLPPRSARAAEQFDP